MTRTLSHTLLLPLLGLVACGSDARFVGAGGNGGGGGGPGDEAMREAIALEEGTYETEVTLADTQAAVDLSAADVAEVSLPGPITAASDEATPKSAAAGPLRPVRFDLGRVLRQLAKNPMVPPCTPAPAIERTPAMTSCRLLGRMGAYNGGVKVRFDACMLPSGARLDGTLQATNVLELADGARCDLAGLAARIKHTLSADVTMTAPDGARAVWTGGATAESKVGRGQPSRTMQVEQVRQRFDVDGSPMLDQHLQGSTQAMLDLASMPPAWVTSGLHTTELRLLGARLTTTATGVRQTLGCCYPTGGSLAIRVERTGKPALERTVTFSATCGQATVDGAAVDLGMCR